MRRAAVVTRLRSAAAAAHRRRALHDIAELRRPGKTADEKANLSAADQLYNKGREYYAAEQYAQAYDEFSKAYEITGDPALLYNRAQALRLLGGRRDQAIALFEQFIAGNVGEDEKQAARAHLDDLKSQGRKQAGKAAQPPF
jgi:tetratricopeptide (TPR) repeat protein